MTFLGPQDHWAAIKVFRVRPRLGRFSGGKTGMG